MSLLALLLLLACPARASDILPEAISDPSMQRNMDYLYGEIRKNTADIVAADTSSQARSTSTILSSNYTQVAYSACIAGSTVSMVTSAVPVDIIFHGKMSMATGTMSLKVLQDGIALNGNLPIVEMAANDSDAGNASFYLPGTSALSAGTHSWCVTIADPNGTELLQCAVTKCKFTAREFKGVLAP